jgi:hypothetical protein
MRAEELEGGTRSLEEIFSTSMRVETGQNRVVELLEDELENRCALLLVQLVV